jgi:predicted ATP-grasp superfamily ATP-dependent carboligase
VSGTGPAAFILGLGENGYGILRSLVREGIAAAGFYSRPEEFGRYSRYCEAHPLPPSLDEERMLGALIERGGRSGGHPVLFATSDYHAFFLARHGERLSGHFNFHWADEASLSRILDKARMSGLCREAGVLAPRTHAVGPEEDPAELARRLAFPCLIKPTRTFANAFPARRKNFVAGSPAEFVAFYAAHPGLKGETVCQEIIEGGDEDIFQCTVLMGRSGEAGAVFCARKLHQYRPGYGVMCFGRSEENEFLAAQSLRLLRCLGYRGLASLEFKYRAGEDRYYFIEMNPRLPWYNALCADAGVNLPYLAYLDLAESRPARAVAARQRNGVHWISFKLDLGWFLQSRLAGRARFFSWLRSLARARSYAWFDRRDPGPFLRSMADLVVTGVRQLFRGLAQEVPDYPAPPSQSPSGP